MIPRTIPELFLNAVERHDKRELMMYKVAGEYVPISAREFREEVELGAHGLIELGIEPGDRVALLSENRPGWAFADLSALFAGAWSVPIYTSLPAEEVQFILTDSGATACFVSTQEQLAKVDAVRRLCPALRHVITLDPIDRRDGSSMSAHALVDLGKRAHADRPDAVTERLRKIGPLNTATILYTSGTTGRPKGVMLSHRNFVSNVVDSLACLPISSDDVHLSFLPLSHSFERTAGYYVMLHAGVTIAFAESIDAVPQNMAEVRPTVMTSVPRLYEKMYARVLQKAHESGGLEKRLVLWARRVAIEWAEKTVTGEEMGAALALRYRLADRLVLAKIRERTGGRLRLFVSGGAPLAPVIAKFFYGAGLPILEGYGLTETSPVITVNRIDAIRFGTVGQPIPNVEIRIDPDPDRPPDPGRAQRDGEILVRGPNVMQGYFNLPELTAQAITEDGWFRTGDIGFVDGEGYLTITDRKKDLLKTSGGKYIAPQPIENELKASKYVSQAVVVGNRRKYATALIVPNADNLSRWAREQGLPADPAKLVEAEEVRALYRGIVDDLNRSKASFETIKDFRLLAEEFSIEAGELTPTLKVKRRVVEEKHADLIDTMYEEEVPAEA
ncbi:MAG: long-chain fatty acid--CoA ligase [Gemmatimonadota bacterium]